MGLICEDQAVAGTVHGLETLPGAMIFVGRNQIQVVLIILVVARDLP